MLQNLTHCAFKVWGKFWFRVKRLVSDFFTHIALIHFSTTFCATSPQQLDKGKIARTVKIIIFYTIKYCYTRTSMFGMRRKVCVAFVQTSLQIFYTNKFTLQLQVCGLFKGQWFIEGAFWDLKHQFDPGVSINHARNILLEVWEMYQEKHSKHHFLKST